MLSSGDVSWSEFALLLSKSRRRASDIFASMVGSMDGVLLVSRILNNAAPIAKLLSVPPQLVNKVVLESPHLRKDFCTAVEFVSAIVPPVEDYHRHRAATKNATVVHNDHIEHDQEAAQRVLQCLGIILPYGGGGLVESKFGVSIWPPNFPRQIQGLPVLSSHPLVLCMLYVSFLVPCFRQISHSQIPPLPLYAVWWLWWL